ncbi:MAG: hybrid sensor histidine kinase/response regulator [Lyngbya sp.]|nr:hybrid sensor histidine kinase/response regulator [Lyngbya sp.]
MSTITQDQSYEFFVQESLELLQTLEQGLMTLSQSHEIKKLHGLMRAAHSIKGGAACVGLMGIQEIAHQLENAIRALYPEDTVFDLELEELLLQAFDCLREPILEQIETGNCDEETAITRAQPIFANLEAKLGIHLEEAVEFPEVPIETDMTLFLFDKEVPVSLRRIQEILASPPANLQEELQAQFEVLATLGSMLNLSGFTAIAQTTMEVLQLHPDLYSEITKVALTDLWSGQKAVLEGDRIAGGKPSAALMKYTQNHSQEEDLQTEEVPVFSKISEGGDLLTKVREEEIQVEEVQEENIWVKEVFLELELPRDSHLEKSDLLEVCELLLQGFDRLRVPLLEQVESGYLPSQEALNVIAPILQQLEAKLGCSLENTSQLSELYLFENRVETATHDEEQVNSNGSQVTPKSNIIEELQTQIEMLATLGNMLNFPKFSEIAQSALEALETDPLSHLKIGVLALAEFWKEQKAILTARNSEVPEEIPEEIPEEEVPEEEVPEEEIPEEVQEKVSPTPVGSPVSPQISLGVRVDVSRLDLINNLVGELATQDNSFLLHNQKSQTALERLETLRDRLRKSLVKSQNYTDFYRSNNQSNPEEYRRVSKSINLLVQKTLEELDEVREVIYDMKWLTLQSQQIIKKRQQTLQKVQKHLTETRMLPVESLLNRFPRMIRDLSIRKQKQVKLELTGKNTLVDKAILEKLYDPLVHLVRNAFDHGIEEPEVRQLRGKSIEGKIEIKAYQQGNYTYVEVKDDGQGINLEKIRSQAIAKGMISSKEAERLSKNQIYEFLFYPDFSTREKVSDLSGRGVGLEAVRSQIEALKGFIGIQSELGKGTTFTLRLPWTLTITKLLVFEIAGSLFAIPLDTLAGIVSASPQEITTDGQQEYYNWYGQKIPLIQSVLLDYNYLHKLYCFSNYKQLNGQNLSNFSEDKNSILLLITQGLETVCLKIDQVLMEQNLTIKPFGKIFTPPSYFYGCTILGDGRLVPVIDSPELLTYWHQQQSSINQLKILTQQEASNDFKKSTVLVIDDSITTRQSLSTMLEKEGYQVLQANNGKEGLIKLEQHPQVKIVICDLEMPEMNGFEFLSHCRRQFPTDVLPILILTSRNNDRHRQLAKQLGSNDYITKPWNEKELMLILQQYLEISQV